MYKLIETVLLVNYTIVHHVVPLVCAVVLSVVSITF